MRERIMALVQDALNGNGSLFLIDVTVSADDRIKVVLDGDQGVSVGDCVVVSRAIERVLEEDDLDFALEVTSAGAASPLIMPRQYHKNLGRSLMVRAREGSYEGELAAVDENGIMIQWKAREAKPIGKGRITVRKTKEIPFSEIEEAKVILKF